MEGISSGALQRSCHWGSVPCLMSLTVPAPPLPPQGWPLAPITAGGAWQLDVSVGLAGARGSPCHPMT